MKYLLFVLALTFTHATNAQGIYQIWGTTPFGGADDRGTIYSVNSNGDDFRLRHEFNSYNPGGSPGSCDLASFNGKFYGTTQVGGANNAGIIFEWNPVSNQYSPKIELTTANGSFPYGSLALKDGKFYGTTYSGGNNNAGVIFEWDPISNIYTKKIDLAVANGSNPYGSMVLKDGRFYGMTNMGGMNNAGVIFEWDPLSNIYTKKIDLDPATGKNPYGHLTFYNGKFYGLCYRGGDFDLGALFEWDPTSNVYTKQVDMSYSIGYLPRGSLTLNDGKFYGMARSMSPSSTDGGVIFEWEPVTNTYHLKVDFTNSPGFGGRNPVGNLTFNNGKFYGMTWGATHGLNFFASRIFEWDPVTNNIIQKVSLERPTGYFPNGSMVLKDGKFYATTGRGGSNGDGVIFEWDPVSNLYSKKIDFNGNDGFFPKTELVHSNGMLYGITRNGGCDQRGVIVEWDIASQKISQRLDLLNSTGNTPAGAFTFHDGKFYGLTTTQGEFNAPQGRIYEWDPATNTYTWKYNFAATEGIPQGSLSWYNNKFYGTCASGGANNVGIIFEWDPVTETFTKKIDLDNSNGSAPQGSMLLADGKFYGMTKTGGTNNAGVIFEWNPATNVYTKKIDLTVANGSNPQGDLRAYNGKFYGMTELGGINNLGVIFEWDAVSNSYLKKVEFNSIDGARPQGNLLLQGNRFFGVTNSGGMNNKGVLFEWDPAGNVYTKKHDFAGANATSFQTRNDLSLVPAAVTPGFAGSCLDLPSITIDNSNNNEWVPVIDNNGNAVAEIKANGNNLGLVTASVFVNDDAVREDAFTRLYLDRNLTLRPTTQPTSPVDIRLYLKNSEYLALKNATNSLGQPSGISSINDVGIFKNGNTCLPNVGANIAAVSTTASSWGVDHVLTGNTTAFSAFYFYSKVIGGPLPLTRLTFAGRLINNTAELKWETTDEYNTGSFDLERSIDGRNYATISNTAAFNSPGVHHYIYVDRTIDLVAAPVYYYRLKQKDLDGRYGYSQIVALATSKNNIILVYPNPVTDKLNMSIAIEKKQVAQLRIVDNTGRIISSQQSLMQSGSNWQSVDVNAFAAGIYYLELSGETINERRRFVKQ